MARITLELIAQELAPDNWKVLSTDYQNLDTEMEFECAEGHKVFAPWKKLRTKRECPVCKQNKLKDIKPIIKEKKKGEQRVLALDQSSHLTGWSIFDGGRLESYGVFKATQQDESKRIHEIKQWVLSMIDNYKPDLIGIEGIQFQEESSGHQMGVTVFQTLARLQGVLIETCIELELPFEIAPTNTWRAHCGVKGRARADRKKSMQLLVKKWYDISVTDDESDAIGIGKFVSETHQQQVEIVSWE